MPSVFSALWTVACISLNFKEHVNWDQNVKPHFIKRSMSFVIILNFPAITQELDNSN